MADEKSVMAVIRAARPTFRNNYDKLAFAVHASFLASGYVLIGTGPSADRAFISSSTDEVGVDHWNEQEDNYTFVYVHPEKGSDIHPYRVTKKVLVKCLVMNDKLLVDALANDSEEPLHVEIDVGNYVGENEGNYSDQFKNLGNLVKFLDKEFFMKLCGSSKPSNSQASEESARDTNDPGSIINDPRVGYFEPTGPQPFPSGFVVPPINPGGGSDLLPGPGAGMYPTRSDFGSGGSMLIGPNDPRWFGGIGQEPSFPGGQPGVPPGARFDPYGPPGVPGFEPNRFVRNPRRPGGNFPGGTHPDLQRFPDGSDFI